MTNTWEKAEFVFPRMGIVAYSFTRKREKAGERTKPREWYRHGIVYDSVISWVFS